jgi:hypothetical protein
MILKIPGFIIPMAILMTFFIIAVVAEKETGDPNNVITEVAEKIEAAEAASLINDAQNNEIKQNLGRTGN